MLSFGTKEDTGQAIQDVLTGRGAVFNFPGMVDMRFNFISGFLHRLLSELDIAFLSELLLVLMKEVISNCSKANAKRIYYESRNLNIQDELVYLRHLPEYSEYVLGNWDEFVAANPNTKYYIKVILRIDQGHLVFEAENNAVVLPRERKRIETRYEAFKKYREMDRAFTEIKDETEGAGLGIVLTMILLQNAGIPPQNFSIKLEKDKTITSLKIPVNVTPRIIKEQFRDRVLAEIDALPSFQKNLTTIIQLCDSQEASIQTIAAMIQKDPSLTAQILKLANSAGYVTRQKNPTVAQAVTIIGMKGLKNLLMVYGARTTLNAKYSHNHKELERIWDMSNRVSFFARALTGEKVAVADQVGLAGLLFALGRIVLLTLSPDWVKKVEGLVDDGRLRNTEVIEEIALGISHPEIGALLAEKWKFPDPLIHCIRYQQKPLHVPEPSRDMIDPVYLAIHLEHCNEEHEDFYAVEPEILEKYNLKTPEDFFKKAKSLTILYNSNSDSH